MGRKKPFIKKGEGVKFYLVHRSQKDPLYLDETLGEHVLVPADPDQEKLIHVMNELHLNEPTTSAAAGASGEGKRHKRIEEQHKYGIYFEDDYDYMQHLKEVRPDDEDEEEANTAEPIKIGSVLVRSDREDDASAAARKAGKLVLPSTVFASKFEEEVGYFNQAAPDHDPKINWDPDIVRLLDEDANIDAEEQIEDDFFIKANGEKDDSDEDTINNDDDDDEDDERDVGSDDGRFDPDFDDSDPERESVRDFETKSRFTNYSMSSSVIRRNKGLQHLDECFEKLFSEYDDDQIGSLDTDDIEGYRKSDLVLEAALSEFSKYIQKGQYTAEPRLETVGERSEDDENEDEDEQNDDELLEYEKKKDKEDRFDCETIISTYSTLYNHPSVIKEEPKKRIELSKKSGLPLGVLHEKAKSQKVIERLNHKITRITPEELNVDVNTIRNPNESKEEKKARKQAIKEHRRERRVEKKINKLAFKEEKKVQIGQINNAMVNKTLVKLPL